MAKGLLLAAFDFSGAHADEFHDWYDLEHIPERQAVPGFGACERWIGVEQPAISVATYDLDSIDVLRSEAYKSIAYGNLSVWSKRVTAMCQRLLRFEGTQLTPGGVAAPEGAGGLLFNAMNVAPEAEADFNAWYDEEHLPALARVPGTLAARRYRSTEAGGGSHAERGVEGGRRHTLERAGAAAFPRPHSHPGAALRSGRVSRRQRPCGSSDETACDVL